MSDKENKSCLSAPISWFPGHMVSAQNDIKENLKLIDIVVEVLDARIPKSSRNPIIDELAKNKARIIVLNKYDLADKKYVEKWEKHFREKGYECIKTNANISDNIQKLIQLINKKGEEIYSNKKNNKKINIKPIYRVLIMGIPNVGKSTIINKIANRQVANTGNKPGVTKKKQWIRVCNNIELLDTPGLLWPKFDDENIGIKLALTGNIKQEVIDIEGLAYEGIKFLQSIDEYKELLMNRYSINKDEIDMEAYELLEIIGKNRGCLVSGGNIDITKTSKLFFEDFKNGKIGSINLDFVDV